MKFLLIRFLFSSSGTTDAHEFLVHALRRAGAPDYVSGVMVGEGLTNDALAAVRAKMMISDDVPHPVLEPHCFHSFSLNTY